MSIRGKKLAITVLGAGNIGCGIAADLSFSGFEVTIFELPEWEENLRPIMQQGGIKVSFPDSETFVEIKNATTKIEEAVNLTDIILIAVPAYGQRKMVELCKPYLKQGQIIVFIPGHMGSLAFSDTLRDFQNDLVIAETNTSPIWCRKVNHTQIKISLKVHEFFASAFPARDNKKFFLKFKPIFPAVKEGKDCLEVMLKNLGPVEHPAMVLFPYGTEKIIKGVDKERLLIGKKFGLALESFEQELFKEESSFLSIPEIVLSFKQGFSGKEIGNLNSRYLTEGVPFGCVFLESLAKSIGTDTPIIKSIITIASVIKNENYQRTGRNLSKLKLDKPTIDEIKRYLTEGKR
jgi:opine dehydrogenase